MAKPKRVKVTVQGAGLSYKAEIDESTAGQIIAWCMSNDKLETLGLPAVEEGHSPVPSRPSGTGESASEYFNRHAPKRNPDKILTLASFLKEIRDQKTFTTKEIKALFRDVGEILPANFKRDFSWASKKNAWIAKEPGRKDGHYVTNTGIRALREGFSKEVLDKTKIRVRGRGRVKKIKK